MKTTFFTFLLFFTNCFLAFGQKSGVQKIDSLLVKTYENLENNFYEFEYDDPIKARLYADAYLKKAKNEKDSIQIARGYKYISFLYIDKENIPEILKYSDSIIFISKNSNHRSYPALGYNQKGIWLFESGKYKEALDNYLIAQEYAVRHNNINQLKDIRLAIAALRNRYGDYNESLTIYKDYLEFIKRQENYENHSTEYYLAGLYNVANGYLRLHKPDSAIQYIDEGLKFSQKVKDTFYYFEFITSSGIINFQKKKFDSAIDSLDKAIKNTKGYTLGICYYYKAECLKQKEQKESSIEYFKKSDSIYQITKDVFPELRQVYENLFDDAKSKNNVQDQLYYIEKVLKTDSLLNSDFKYISKNIIKKYDTALLLDDKQAIIKRLGKQNKNSSYVITLLSLFMLILIIGFIFYNKHRNKLYKKRFQKLIEQKSVNDKKKPKEDKSNSSTIADDVTMIILQKLKRFEKEKKYLEQGITLSKVANQLQTNSSYLSKVVNTHMQKTFNTYINDLRIEYVVEKLKKDTKFRKYAVKSIAEEIGYANSQSFANAFYKKTGIKPSYFIKQIKSS